MEKFDFHWKYKDFEIRTINSYASNEPYVELVKWNVSWYAKEMYDV